MSTAYPIPTLIAQSASPLYNLCHDLLLYFKGQSQDIRDLKERITKLTIDLTLMNSGKERIDRFLRHSVSAEESHAFKVMEVEIKVIHRKYTKFINKYTKMTKTQLVSTTDPPDVFSIDRLDDLKSKIMTFNFFKLAKLSRDVVKLNRRASEALGRLKVDDMTHKKERLNQVKFNDDDVLEMFDPYVDEVLEYLCENRNTVGILGCRGVGKTTVLRKLYNRLLNQKSLSADEKSPRLDNIIWIEYPPRETEETEKTEKEKNVEEAAIVEKLQNDIMEQLDIPHEAATTVTKNENTISTFLCNKRYILLMDHVSTYINLEKLGLRKNHKYKNVVICSREKQVIRKTTKDEVIIGGLKDQEALKLFQNISGKFPDERKEAIAKRIIECCAGIPWMIRGVANYLADKSDEDSWHSVKDILQSDSRSLELIGVGGFDKVYEITYKGLATETKKCLLYGALFPHHYKIETDYLIECWIAEGFIAKEANQKVRMNRHHGQTILNYLTDQYLLHWYDGKKYVMMPPDFRRVASKLDYPNEKKCAVWVPSEHKNPDDDTWTRVTRMSLIGCKMELPQSPNCCNLYTLLLESMKQESTRIPGLFFTHMKSLQVLGLNQTNIGGLPESIKELVNLKSLYLNGCQNLIALPSGAADLVKLEFLDMCGTSIPTLPGEIRSMVRMRCLRASLSPKGKSVEEIIAPNIISNLKNLEELSIVTTFDIEIASAERLAKELASLEHLNTLCFNFPNLSSLNTFVTQSKALNNMDTSWREHTFRSFKIFIGCHETRHSHKQDFSNILSESERWLRYSTNEVFSPDCQKLLNQASAFEIIGQDGLKSFTSSQFDLRSIKVCVVEGCKYMKNIIDGYIANEAQGFVNVSLLKSLENLYLYDLESLECICDGPVPSTTLSNLTAITINGCHKLTEVLHPALTCSLKSLEYLKVSNCGKISKIIETRGETSETGQELSNSDLLRSLRKIEMTNLPELESIFGSSCSSNISWNSLRSIIIMRCNKLSNLCLTLTNAKKLASIRCEESWWDTSIPHEVKQHFLSVCSFWDESVEGGAQPRGQASTILRHQE